MGLLKCKNCDREISVNDKFCGFCGTKNDILSPLEDINTTRLEVELKRIYKVLEWCEATNNYIDLIINY